jgi:putative aldouronate transport system substrate-binding protein
MVKRKTMSLLAITLVTAVAVSGCSTKTEGDSSASPSQSTKPSDAAKKEKVALTWFVPAANNAQLPSADKDFVKQAIESKFNVDLKMIYLGKGPDFASKLNTMIASGEIPDIFYSDGLESVKYIKDGVARDLTGLVTPATMPNYFKYWVTEADIKGYQVNGVYKRAPLPFPKTEPRSYYVRKDWLDKLNLKMPETYDDMVAVMKAFTEQDPDGNGKNDTYGFSASGNGANLPLDFPEYIKNGLIGDFLIENNQFVDVRTDARMQNVLTDVKKVMDMKVIDPDWLLNKGVQNIEKAQQGKVGIILGGTRDIAYDNNPDGLQVKTKAVTGNPKVDWQPFHIGAKTGVWREPLPLNPFLVSAKATDEKAKRSIEILDWLSSEEGFLLTKYGKEGVHYKRNGNSIEQIVDAYKKDIIDNGNFLSVYGWFAQSEITQLGLTVVDPNMSDRDRAIAAKLASYKLIPSVGTSLVVKDGMDLAGIRKKMSEDHIQILFKEKDASKWPAMRQELMDKYGAKALFDYYAEQVAGASGKPITFK